MAGFLPYCRFNTGWENNNLAQETSENLTLVWLRRDLRLSDNRALVAAAERGAVVPVFVLDELFEQMGAAPKLRMMLSLQALAQDLEARGLRLILRRGPARGALEELVAATGANAVYWSRGYAPDVVARDSEIKTALKDRGLAAQSFTGTLLFEPWTVETQQGAPFRVYSPFWRAVRTRSVAPCLDVPELHGPTQWPASDSLETWHLDREMRRGAAVVSRFVAAGEQAAQRRLAVFLEERIEGYKAERDFLDRAATSELSDALSYGEISPAQMWHAGQRAMQEGAAGAEHFLKEVVWREFAWHLMWFFPTIAEGNWREAWDAFEWIEDADHPHFQAWCQGRTGVALVDAAMRELYVTGKMHNRARMLTASYLTKHLNIHWKLGLKWFEDCLVDWDPASNAMGWQWVAGSGPDAAPYFRIFNPDTQAEKFDADGRYRKQWLSHAPEMGSDTAALFFAAMPLSWQAQFEQPQREAIVSLATGRQRALAAYEAFKA